jgi:gamma-glutamyltranspeptidase/glutathione hydrolase
MLQALNILEGMNLKEMGYNSTRYLHAIYQAMNLAFADRDFYYGDTAYQPQPPGLGLLSKEYAQARAKTIDWARNDADARPGDPIHEGRKNPSSICWRNGGRRIPSRRPTLLPPRAAPFEPSRRASTPARRRSRRRTPRAGWFPSRRRAAGSRRSSRAKRESG